MFMCTAVPTAPAAATSRAEIRDHACRRGVRGLARFPGLVDIALALDLAYAAAAFGFLRLRLRRLFLLARLLVHIGRRRIYDLRVLAIALDFYEFATASIINLSTFGVIQNPRQFWKRIFIG